MAGRRSRVLGILAILLLVVPIVEVAVIVAVGRTIGGWPTLGLLLLESAIGAWVVQREGGRAWQALRSALRTGRMPARELTEGILVLVGGTLLLTPGFVSDVVGFCCVLPFTRPVARRMLEGAIRRRLLGRSVTTIRTPRRRPGAGTHPDPADDIIEGEVL